MNKQERIGELIRQISGKPVPPDPDESLFESGLLDSFALPDLVTALESTFNCKIPDSDLNPRKFDSITRIEEYLAAKGV